MFDIIFKNTSFPESKQKSQESAFSAGSSVEYGNRQVYHGRHSSPGYRWWTEKVCTGLGSPFLTPPVNSNIVKYVSK